MSSSNCVFACAASCAVAGTHAAEDMPQPFELPFPVDGDKLGNYIIKLRGILNKETKLTKALKLMLADLKMALQWMIKKEGSSGYRQLPTFAQEGPVPAVPSASSGVLEDRRCALPRSTWNRSRNQSLLKPVFSQTRVTEPLLRTSDSE